MLRAYTDWSALMPLTDTTYELLYLPFPAQTATKPADLCLKAAVYTVPVYLAIHTEILPFSFLEIKKRRFVAISRDKGGPGSNHRRRLM